MKLLLDQKLSWRLARDLQNLFKGSVHVRELGLDRATDEAIWDYAQREGFVILSKDADFEQRSLLRGHPPKCVWLRVGNCSTDAIITRVRDNAAIICDFGETEAESYMVLP